MYSQADVEVSSLWSIYGHVLFIECSDSYIMQSIEKMARNFIFYKNVALNKKSLCLSKIDKEHNKL